MAPVQPAYETILEHHGHVVVLRASLRAAIDLDALPGGFNATVEGVMGQSYTSIRDVLLASATDRAAAVSLLAAAAHKPLAPFMAEAQAVCLSIFAAFLPQDSGTASTQGASAKPVTMRDYLGELFRFGTGWLGWTPAEVWNASPGEIEAAFLAHIDRLVKITPGASLTEGAGGAETISGNPGSTSYTPKLLEQLHDENNVDLDPNFDRQGLRALKARHGA